MTFIEKYQLTKYFCCSEKLSLKLGGGGKEDENDGFSDFAVLYDQSLSQTPLKIRPILSHWLEATSFPGHPTYLPTYLYGE